MNNMKKCWPGQEISSLNILTALPLAFDDPQKDLKPCGIESVEFRVR